MVGQERSLTDELAGSYGGAGAVLEKRTPERLVKQCKTGPAGYEK